MPNYIKEWPDHMRPWWRPATVVGDRPPECPDRGDLFWDTKSLQLYVWTGREWVAASCCEDDDDGDDIRAVVSVGSRPPECPQEGRLWFSTGDLSLYVWSGREWIAASCCEPGSGGGGGAPGPPGPAGTVAIGSTSTLSPGASASVTNSGTPQAAVLSFGIPAGLQGAMGPQGPQGPKGDPGSGLSFVGIVPTTAQLPVPPPAIADGTMYLVQANNHLYVWVASPAPGSWQDTGASPGGGIPEAPADGRIYGRFNDAWLALLDDGVYA